MSKPQKHTTNTVANWFSRHKRLRWTVSIVAAIYVLSLFTPCIKGYTQFPLYFVKCWGKPIEADNFWGVRSYYLPSNRHYSLFFADHYFCSEAEAKAAGYQSDMYNH